MLTLENVRLQPPPVATEVTGSTCNLAAYDRVTLPFSGNIGRLPDQRAPEPIGLSYTLHCFGRSRCALLFEFGKYFD